MTSGRPSAYLIGFILLRWLQLNKASASSGLSNVALNKTATQSTTEADYWVAERAVDGERLRNLSIQIGKQEDGMTETAFFAGPGTNGSIHEIPIANFIGRYVKLEIANTINAILTLCEVKVMGTEVRRGRKFNKIEGWKSSASSLGELNAAGVLYCAALCLQKSGCAAANYDLPNSSCQLLSSSEPTIEATGYTMITEN